MGASFIFSIRISSSRSRLGDKFVPAEIGDDAGNVEHSTPGFQRRYAFIERFGVISLSSKSTSMSNGRPGSLATAEIQVNVNTHDLGSTVMIRPVER